MRKREELSGEGVENGGRSDTDLPKSGNPSFPGNGGGVNGGLRRYLVLLQDCLAIKFVSISQLEQKRTQKYNQHQQQQNPSSVPVKCQYNGNSGSNHVAGESGNKSVNRKQSDYEIIGGGSRCQSRCSIRLWESEKGTFKGNDDTIYSSRKNICGGGPCPNFQALTPTFPHNEKLSMMSKVDHSMQALFLYKEFREINLHCFWNSAVTEAFTHMEYKGSLLPSTIIVGSSIRKYLTILKTAWSRKMLRSPSGYLIDFLGEIEELIADPIAKSHFVPLSDSLCWAIHELTSSGEEAFVDDICLRLVTAYPGMALPTKELIYQTLEKLTRERKIYQTAQGYFVVTPDTHRYISATEPWLMIQSNSQINSSHFLSPSPPNLDEVIVGKDDKKGAKDGDDARNDYPSRNAPSPDSDTYSLPYGTFKRYNSLRIKKNGGTSTTTGCLSRTLSMRLPKSKSKQIGTNSSSGGGVGDDISKPRASDVVGSFQNQTVSEQLLTRRRKHKSFLSRLLSFHGVRRSTRKAARANKTQTIAISRNDKKVPISNNGDGDNDENGSGDSKNESTRETNLATTSTQTNISIENLSEDLALMGLVSNGQHPTSKESTLEREQDADSGRCTDSHSDADAEITAALSRGRFTPTLYPEGRRGKDTNRNVYDKIESELGLKVDVGECDGSSPRSPSQSHSHISNSPSPSTFTNASLTASGRMSQSGVNSRNNNHRCHSAASSSGYSYRDFYNVYRRRHYPSYYHQQSSSTPTPTSPTSQESTSELNELDGGKPIKPNIRYPPRSFERKQIFDEVTGRNSFREKKRNLHKSVSIATGDNSPGKFSPRAGRHDGGGERNNSNDIHSTTTTSTSTSTVRTPASPNSSTTTFTQTLKNSTNLELEFHLPLGNLISAAMNNAENDFKRPPTRQTNTKPDYVGGEEEEKTQKSPQRPTTRTTSTLSEVNTMVNDLFTIKSFVKSNPFNDGELSSIIEFKTRVSANNLENSTINNNNNGNNGTAQNRDQKDHRHHHHHRQHYMIETVSAKPYTSVVHTKFNRESEII